MHAIATHATAYSPPSAHVPTKLFAHEVSQHVASHFQRRTDLKLLEAGCGALSHFHFEGVGKITGIDISREQLDRNRIVDEKILGDLQCYPLGREEYDIVICWDVVEHLSRPEDAIQNMMQAVKVDGLLLLGFPHLFSFKGLATKFTPFFVHRAFYRFLRSNELHFPTYLRLFIRPSNVVRYARDNGFTVLYADLKEGGVTRKFRQKLAVANFAMSAFDKLLSAVSFGQCHSLFLDNCAFVLKKERSLFAS